MSSLVCDLPPSTLIESLERDSSMTKNSAWITPMYVHAINYVLCQGPHLSLCGFHDNGYVICCLELCVYLVWIHVPLRIHRCGSMSHNEMFSTGCLHADEMLNECTILLTLESCSSRKSYGICSLNTVKYSTLHGIEMYVSVFMVNKSLSWVWTWVTHRWSTGTDAWPFCDNSVVTHLCQK